jgi:hypothetical protein
VTPAEESTQVEAEAERPVDPVMLCQAVQASEEVPISCAFDLLDGKPFMLLGVRSREVLAATLDDMLKLLVEPFCSAQNAAGERAGVLFAVGTQARQLDCATLALSDWVETDPVVARTVAIEQGCARLQRADYGVTCSLMDLEGTPAMILSYRRGEQAQQNLPSIAREIGAPFCELTNAANARGAIVFLDDQLTGRIFDCATSDVSAPISYRKERKPAPRPKQQPSGSSQPKYAMAERWELLPVRSH